MVSFFSIAACIESGPRVEFLMRLIEAEISVGVISELYSASSCLVAGNDFEYHLHWYVSE